MSALEGGASSMSGGEVSLASASVAYMGPRSIVLPSMEREP